MIYLGISFYITHTLYKMSAKRRKISDNESASVENDDSDGGDDVYSSSEYDESALGPRESLIVMKRKERMAEYKVPKPDFSEIIWTFKDPQVLFTPEEAQKCLTMTNRLRTYRTDLDMSYVVKCEPFTEYDLTHRGYCFSGKKKDMDEDDVHFLLYATDEKKYKRYVRYNLIENDGTCFFRPTLNEIWPMGLDVISEEHKGLIWATTVSTTIEGDISEDIWMTQTSYFGTARIDREGIPIETWNGASLWKSAIPAMNTRGNIGFTNKTFRYTRTTFYARLS